MEFRAFGKTPEYLLAPQEPNIFTIIRNMTVLFAQIKIWYVFGWGIPRAFFLS